MGAKLRCKNSGAFYCLVETPPLSACRVLHAGAIVLVLVLVSQAKLGVGGEGCRKNFCDFFFEVTPIIASWHHSLTRAGLAPSSAMSSRTRPLALDVQELEAWLNESAINSLDAGGHHNNTTEAIAQIIRVRGPLQSLLPYAPMHLLLAPTVLHPPAHTFAPPSTVWFSNAIVEVDLFVFPRCSPSLLHSHYPRANPGSPPQHSECHHVRLLWHAHVQLQRPFLC